MLATSLSAMLAALHVLAACQSLHLGHVFVGQVAVVALGLVVAGLVVRAVVASRVTDARHGGAATVFTMLATLCRTTTLEAADVLGAIALFVGLAHVTVDEGVGGQSLATVLAGLAARMLVGFFTVRLGDDLAALFELTTREGAKPRLGFSVKGISGCEVGCVDFGLFSGADEASNLALHRRSGGFGCFRHGRLLGGSRTSPRGCFSLVHGAWQRIAEFGCQV